MGFSSPTEIQGMSIPEIMEGRDVIGESATGSGKTLAFGCGIIDSVTPGHGLQSLIMTPTRELAEQVKDSLIRLSGKKGLKIISVYGGVGIDPQIEGLRTADVVVGTPGRLLDHMQRRTINTSKVKILVLDEADRMFDMGFIEDVEKIIRVCPRERQTLFFSATISQRIKNLANRYMKDPVRVNAKNQVDPSKLHQEYYNVTRQNKFSMLVHLCEKEASGLVMIFCNTRRSVDFVVKNLKAQRFDAVSIHGGLTQNKRTRMLKMFNSGKVGFLVCTDVAARGLHIDNVSHIYNYEIPKDPTDYVHRIGRTARAGEEGKVINLLCDLDFDNMSKVLRDYRFNVQKMESPNIRMVPVKKSTDSRRGHGRPGFRSGPGRGGLGRGGSGRGGPRDGSRGSGRFSRDKSDSSGPGRGSGRGSGRGRFSRGRQGRSGPGRGGSGRRNSGQRETFGPGGYSRG
jgi:ATP-dependent RNA helicase DeaD